MVVITCCVLVVLLGLSTAQVTKMDFDCSDRHNGFFFWWACGSYGVCRNGKYYQIDCVNGTSFDRNQKECVKSERGVTFPCNGGVRCDQDLSHGHRYPVLEEDPLDGLPACTFYYTCAHGYYMGHQMCNPGSVYDEISQSCKHPSLVRQPCGFYDDEYLPL